MTDLPKTTRMFSMHMNATKFSTAMENRTGNVA